MCRYLVPPNRDCVHLVYVEHAYIFAKENFLLSLQVEYDIA